MKKYLVLCAGFCAAMALTSCNTSKESAYKKAYEKAKAQEQKQAPAVVEQPTQTETAVVTPLTPATPATQTTVSNVDNATVRSESVTVVDGDGLQAFSVVVGSYSLKANAEGVQSTLKAGGYNAQIVYNSAINMYRVVASTFNDKGQAVQSRDAIRGSQYNPKGDAWLLFKK